MMSKKRIFIGLLLSKKLQNKIEKWEKHFLHLPVRWIGKDFLHVTVIPVWYEENVSKISSLLQSVKIPINSFSVSFNHISLGPERKHPRLVWATGEVPPEFVKLKKFLEKCLQRPSKKKDLIFHTTLARFNRKQFVELKKFNNEFPEYVNWSDTFSSFSLIQSHLKRSGATYEVIEDIPF